MSKKYRVLARLSRNHSVIVELIQISEKCYRITRIRNWDGVLPSSIANQYIEEHESIEDARRYVVDRLADYFKQEHNDQNELLRLTVVLPRNRIKELESIADLIFA